MSITLADVTSGRVSTERGACTCGAVKLDDCTCEWGETIRDMIALGYSSPPLQRAILMKELLIRVTQVITAARGTAIRAAAASWPGTQGELAAKLKVSPGRVRQFTTGEQPGVD